MKFATTFRFESRPIPAELHVNKFGHDLVVGLYADLGDGVVLVEDMGTSAGMPGKTVAALAEALQISDQRNQNLEHMTRPPLNTAQTAVAAIARIRRWKPAKLDVKDQLNERRFRPKAVMFAAKGLRRFSR